MSLDITHNVRIVTYDTNHKIQQVITKHNKASKNLVLGIIKFLRGEFTPSNNSESNLTHKPNEAKSFVPAFVSFGDGGINQYGTPLTGGGYVQDFDQVIQNMSNTTLLTPSKFNMTKLNHELVGANIGNAPNINKPPMGRCKITRTSYSNDTDDAITLKLSSLIPVGYYPKNFYLDTASERDGKPLYLSELGLWSCDFNGSSDNMYKGNLLARVVFDAEHLVEQKESDIILVDWKIEITSLNDYPGELYQTDINWEVNTTSVL